MDSIAWHACTLTNSPATKSTFLRRLTMDWITHTPYINETRFQIQHSCIAKIQMSTSQRYYNTSINARAGVCVWHMILYERCNWWTYMYGCALVRGSTWKGQYRDRYLTHTHTHTHTHTYTRARALNDNITRIQMWLLSLVCIHMSIIMHLCNESCSSGWPPVLRGKRPMGSPSHGGGVS